jgi:quercetin dioxygenase-like cupin family protein
MQEQMAFRHEQDGSWVEVAPGVERMIMGYNESLMIVKVRFRKDAVGELHSHSHIQSAYIARGSFEVTINGETRLLHEGDTFFVESNLVHGVRCIKDGLLIDNFNPCREDFL